MQRGIAFAGLQVSHASSTSIPAAIRAIISVYVSVKKYKYLQGNESVETVSNMLRCTKKAVTVIYFSRLVLYFECVIMLMCITFTNSYPILFQITGSYTQIYVQNTSCVKFGTCFQSCDLKLEGLVKADLGVKST